MASNMANRRFCLVWYFHLPWICDDQELDDLVRESLNPLVSAHAAVSAPMTLAITGALLDRLAHRHQALIDMITDMADRGIVELAATFFHEVLPPILPLAELEAHLAADVQLKEQLFGRRPGTFLPGNFTWVASLNELLVRFGVRRVVLDGGHLHRATSIQRWRWSIHETTVFDDCLVPIGLGREWLHRPYRLRCASPTDGLDLLFRDTQAVMAVSAGHEGALQQPLDPDVMRAALADIDGDTGTVVLADDGDRINALSAFGYRGLLSRIGPERLVTSEEAAASPRHRLDYLPGYTIADLHGFWLADPDAVHWVRVLDDIRRSNPAVTKSSEFLRLHDVYPLFWRNHWRCRLFWSEAERIGRNTAGNV